MPWAERCRISRLARKMARDGRRLLSTPQPGSLPPPLPESLLEEIKMDMDTQLSVVNAGVEGRTWSWGAKIVNQGRGDFELATDV